MFSDRFEHLRTVLGLTRVITRNFVRRPRVVIIEAYGAKALALKRWKETSIVEHWRFSRTSWRK